MTHDSSGQGDGDKNGGHHAGPADDNRPDHTPGATEQIIALFDGIRPMASKLGIPVTTVQGWKKRQAIPANRHDEIRKAAETHGIALDDVLLVASAQDASSDETAADSDPHLAREAEDEASPTATERARHVKQAAASSLGEPMKEPNGQNSQPDPDQDDGRPAAYDAMTPPVSQTGGHGLVTTIAVLALLLSVMTLAGLATAPRWIGQAAAKLGIELGATETRADLERMQGELTAMQSQLDTMRQHQPAAKLTRRLDQLERKLDQSLKQLSHAAQSATGISAQDIEQMRRDIGRDLAPIADSVHSMETRLDRLEQQQRQAGLPTRTVSLVLAIGNLNSRLNTSAPYAEQLAAVRQLAAGRPALNEPLATLQTDAGTGIPTPAELANRFAGLSGKALAAIHGETDTGLLGEALSQLQSLVTIRRAPGEIEGDDPPALLARAEYLLRQGDVSGAYTLTQRLPAAAGPVLADWRRMAEARIAADEAVAALIKTTGSTVGNQNGSSADNPD